MACNHELIYDVGLHKGEDTEFYLKKGYQVVAFEANPSLVSLCRDRFKSELSSGQLHIIEGAIAPSDSGDWVTFYVNTKISVWGTVDQSWVKRNKLTGADSQKCEVYRVDIAEVLKKFGMPFYMKIDIEGSDSLLLSTIRDLTDRPQYISIEANTVDIYQLEQDIETLYDLGYRKFQAVQQSTIPGSHVHSRTLHGERIEHTFSEAASGMFGDDLAADLWVDRDIILNLYKSIIRRQKLFGAGSVFETVRGGRRVLRLLDLVYGSPLAGWYDTHASLGVS